MGKIKKEMTEPEYRAQPCVSYSALSSLDSNPGNLKAGPMEMTEPLIYGSAVDCLAFDGMEEFKKKFATITVQKPNWSGIKLFNAIYEELQATLDITETLSNNLADYPDTLLRVARSENYGGDNWRDETIVNKLIKSYGNYYKALIDVDDKLLLDPQQYEYVVNSVQTLYTHDFTRDYFLPKDGQEVFYQFPIIWEYKSDDRTIHCKSLLDIMLIDHNEKKIYPIDLKTTGKSVLAFPKSFIEWKYYLQASFYTDAVIYLRDKIYPELSDYSVELFKFVVISSKNPMKPLSFQITPENLKAGKFGGILKNSEEYKKGYLELIDDMNWHIDNDKYQYPKEVYDNNGLMTLDNFK